MLVDIDVERMAIRNKLETALSSARMTALVQGDTEYVYLPGNTDTLRFRVTDDGFIPDPAWSAPYRMAKDGTQPGVAMTPTGNHELLCFRTTTPCSSASAPLEVLWQSTTDNPASVFSVNATMTDLPGGSFAPPPVDPFTTRSWSLPTRSMAGSAAWRIADDGTLQNLWTTDATPSPSARRLSPTSTASTRTIAVRRRRVPAARSTW